MWRFIDSGLATAGYNMAVDEAILDNFKEDDVPVLRLYSWEPSLSLGRFSDITKSVDLNILRNKSLPYVRRITGGGILVHGGDLSYSIVLPKRILKNMNVKISYHYLCQFIINFYKRLGHNAVFAEDLNLNISKSNICMMSNEPYDIIIEGKKIGGNAQRYTKNILLQHGSIPINFDYLTFKNVFLENSGLAEISTLDKIGNSVTIENLKSTLIEAFIDTFDADIVKDDLNQIEKDYTNELLTHKYMQKRWNLDAKYD